MVSGTYVCTGNCWWGSPFKLLLELNVILLTMAWVDITADIPLCHLGCNSGLKPTVSLIPSGTRVGSGSARTSWNGWPRQGENPMAWDKNIFLNKLRFVYICIYTYIYVYMCIYISIYIYLTIRYIYIHSCLQTFWALDIYQYIHIYQVHCGKGRKFTSRQTNLDKHVISLIYWAYLPVATCW